jgi:acetyl esterase
MSKTPTREELIKKGRQLHGLMVDSQKLQNFFAKKNPSRREIFIDTEFGRARTLWYGLENEAKSPVFFDLHGGGFVIGSAEMDDVMNMQFYAQVGCKIVSIDYAKAPDFPFPAALDQIYAVVEHVRANAEKYAVDVHKMAIGGHSAGANLSAAACIKAKRAGKFQFGCQVLDYPVLDFVTANKPHPKGSISPEMARMFNACYILPDQANDPLVSPVCASREELIGLPPALFILAGGDSLHDEGVKYCRMLQEVGVATELHEYPDSPHGFTYKRSIETTDAVAKMSAFLKKYLY